jgi:hypothetical protein
MKQFFTTASLVLSIIFAHNLSAKVLVELDDFPDWFKDSMAREIKIEKQTQIKIDTFSVDKKVKGKVTLVEEGDGTWYYNIDIGTGSPVECYVFAEYDGTATSFYSVIEHSLTGVEAINKKSLSAKFNYAIDSGVIGSTPYLLLDTLYNLGEGTEKVAGVLKGLAAQTQQSLQICFHNEIGYQQAFFETFESIIQAFEQSEEKTEFFKPVYQITINDMPIGYGREKYTIDADGDINIEKDSAFIFPVDSSSIARSDSVSTEWSYPDGSLINATVYNLENGVLTSQFSIGFENDKWNVEGELQGKQIKSVLEYNGILISGFGSHLETAKLRQSKKESEEFNMWVPEADPTSTLKVVMSKLADDPNANLEIDMGPLLMKIMADENGVLKHGTMEQAGMIMDLKLIYASGKPSL